MNNNESDEIGGPQNWIVLAFSIALREWALALYHRKLLLRARFSLKYAAQLVHLQKSIPVAKINREILHVRQALQYCVD